MKLYVSFLRIYAFSGKMCNIHRVGTSESTERRTNKLFGLVFLRNLLTVTEYKISPAQIFNTYVVFPLDKQSQTRNICVGISSDSIFFF